MKPENLETITAISSTISAGATFIYTLITGCLLKAALETKKEWKNELVLKKKADICTIVLRNLKEFKDLILEDTIKNGSFYNAQMIDFMREKFITFTTIFQDAEFWFECMLLEYQELEKIREFCSINTKYILDNKTIKPLDKETKEELRLAHKNLEIKMKELLKNAIL